MRAFAAVASRDDALSKRLLTTPWAGKTPKLKEILFAVPFLQLGVF